VWVGWPSQMTIAASRAVCGCPRANDREDKAASRCSLPQPGTCPNSTYAGLLSHTASERISMLTRKIPIEYYCPFVQPPYTELRSYPAKNLPSLRPVATQPRRWTQLRRGTLPNLAKPNTYEIYRRPSLSRFSVSGGNSSSISMDNILNKKPPNQMSLTFRTSNPHGIRDGRQTLGVWPWCRCQAQVDSRDGGGEAQVTLTLTRKNMSSSPLQKTLN